MKNVLTLTRQRDEYKNRHISLERELEAFRAVGKAGSRFSRLVPFSSDKENK